MTSVGALPPPNNLEDTPPAPDDPTGQFEIEEDAKQESPPRPPPVPMSMQLKQSHSETKSGSAKASSGLMRMTTPPSTSKHAGYSSSMGNSGIGRLLNNKNEKNNGPMSGKPLNRGASIGLPKIDNHQFQQKFNAPDSNEEKTNASANPLAPAGAGGGGVSLLPNVSPLDDIKDEALEAVEFTALLRQVDVGLEMTELLKEVIRKYSKHQNADSVKLMEIYGKMKNTYADQDGMQGFAEVCNLTHKLILETVQQQKRLAEFLGTELVPRLQQHLQEKQAAVQILKKENQQAELRLNNSISHMKKAENSFKSAAKKARQAADPGGQERKKTSDRPRGFGAQLNQFKKQIAMGTKGGSKDSQDPGYEEYLKATAAAQNYEATVMKANHAQEKHLQICRHFKYRLRSIEESRMAYCTQQMTLCAAKHKEMFENGEIDGLRRRVMTGAADLSSSADFDAWVKKEIARKGGLPAANAARQGDKFKAKSFNYENVFYSLDDAMKITRKALANQLTGVQLPKDVSVVKNVPLIMTVLCDKVRQLGGFKMEGIFRISASGEEAGLYKKRLFNHNYKINTKDAHLPASLLKFWIGHLKEPLIPFGYYNPCLEMVRKDTIDAQRLDVFISQLPELNRDAIRYLVSYVKEIIRPENVKTSKMTLKNIGIVLAPNVLRPPSEDMSDPGKAYTDNEDATKFFNELVKKLNC